MTGGNKQAFKVEDLYLHSKVLETSCASDGNLVVCTVRSVDKGADKYVYKLWAFGPQQPGRALTSGAAQDKSPKLSPDGKKLAFISDRSGSSQIHLLDLAGGEAQQLSSFPKGVISVEWGCGGSVLLATAAVEVDPDQRGDRSKPPKERKSKAEVAWRLPYKADGIGYQLGREVHLFKVDAETGEAVQLTDGPFDVFSAAVSPDGKQVAYTRTRSGLFAHRSDLWVCDLDGSGHRQLTSDLATVMEPKWSPDGRFVAVIGAEKEGDAQSQFWLCDVQAGGARPLGSGEVEPASGEPFRWRDDGSAIQFIRARHGRHCLASISVPDGRVAAIHGPDRQLAAFGPSEGALFYCVEHPSLPSELWTCTPDGSGERKLSDLNPWWHDRIEIDAKVRRFEVPDGRGGTETIEGWLLQPTGFRGPAPLLNDVHGGPAAYALMDFDTNVFWQVLCSAGWSVLALNAVGSASYGREFCGRVAGHWGEYDLPQHIAAIEALKSEGVCDDRVAISGKSYGGFLSAYAIGNCGTFKAAVVMAPVGNIETHYGTSDGGYYADPLYMGTAPEFDRQLARKLSPLHHIEQACTPTLFMNGKEDERCPKCQSEELFVSMLRARRAAAELVLYPGETHGFLGEGAPSTREDAADRIVDWISQYALGDRSANKAGSEHKTENEPAAS